MSSIQEILASILQAVYGKDVRQAIHDGVEMAYNKADNAETSAAAAADAASGSQNSAAASAQAAANSASSASDFADAAEQYKNEAFHTTPAGYEAFVSNTNSSLDYLIDMGVKNCCPIINRDISEYADISYPSDGTIVIDGNTTGQVALYPIRRSRAEYRLPAGTYKFSGFPPSESGNSSYCFEVIYATSNGNGSFGRDIGSGLEFTVTPAMEADSAFCIGLSLYIPNGKTFNNMAFKPMITLASVANSDYAHFIKYSMPSVDLTDFVQAFWRGERIVSSDIVVDTANVVIDTGITFTLEKRGMVFVTASYANARPLYIAVARKTYIESSQSYHYQVYASASIENENFASGSNKSITNVGCYSMLQPNTEYCILVKYAYTSSGETITVWK